MNMKKIISEISMTDMALLITAPTVASASNINYTKSHYEHPSEVRTIRNKKNNDALYEFSHTKRDMLGMSNPNSKARNRNIKIVSHNKIHRNNMHMSNNSNVPMV